LEAFAFEGTRARSRNKDGKNVPNATTAFKTAALNNHKYPDQVRHDDAVC
jgi:hypothetical protein